MTQPQESCVPSVNKQLHSLSDTWTLWGHLPHDTDWSLESYKNILTFNHIEEIISLNHAISEKMVKNCMLFMMKDGIQPIWEDPQNRNGGCFSYRISNRIIKNVWDSLSYLIVGKTCSKNKDLINNINGITVSPKKNFCILKIWLKNTDHQNPEEIINFSGLTSEGCLFKRHNPEY